MKECIQYYYLWKKVCPDEHKRLRVIRNKRERERLYNLRSQQQQQQQQPQEQQGIIGETSGKVEMDFDNDSGSSTDMEDAGNDLVGVYELNKIIGLSKLLPFKSEHFSQKTSFVSWDVDNT